MSSLALALTLSVTSGGLLAEQSPLAFSARLITSAVPTADVEGMSRTELEMERARLIDTKLSIGPGLGLLIGGGATTLFLGLPFLLFGIAEYYIDVVIVGVILTVLGVGAIVGGIIALAVVLSARSASAARVGQIDDRIRRMEENATPPPPPPPPSGWVVPAEPALRLATF